MDAPKDYQESDRIVGASPLLAEVRDHIRRLHYSIRTETAYLGWIKRYVLFHGKRLRPRRQFRQYLCIP